MLKRCLLFTLLAGIAGSSHASETSISFGGFYSHSDSTMNVTNPSLGNDFELDFESDLELAEKQFLPFFELEHQFAENHHFYVDWKQLHRNAETQALSKPFQVQIDDTVYDVKAGGQLTTTLNIDIARIGYGYDFIQGNNYTVGVSVGIHAMFIKTGFEGTIGACNITDVVGNICAVQEIPSIIDESVTAPLPDIGIYGSYHISPRWQLSAHAQYFKIKLDDVEGSLIDVRAGAEAEIAKNWFMSAAFNYYKVDVDIEQTGDSTGIADYNVAYSFIGPMLSITYKF